jgi:hypothetical protein
MCRVVGNGMESWPCLHLFVEQTVFGHESRLQHQDRGLAAPQECPTTAHR